MTLTIVLCSIFGPLCGNPAFFIVTGGGGVQVGWFDTEAAIWMVLELGSGGDLQAVLAKRGSLNREAARFYSAEIVCGLSALHSHGVLRA